jgi:DUF4097 and DUF4098 domain-containing protein YvlB
MFGVPIILFIAVWAANAQAPVFQRTLNVGIKDPLELTIDISRGDVTVAYSRDGEVSISASAKDSTGKDVSTEIFGAGLIIEQKESRLTIHESKELAGSVAVLSVSYRINVPFRTHLNSSVSGAGNQKIMGISGPAKVRSHAGDITVTYIPHALLEAILDKGNISCTRVMQVNAETGNGNITLLESGPSKAFVREGRGRVEVSGARGSIEGSVDAGSIHIKAVPHDNWKLSSASGSIRIEIPPKGAFEIDAATISGEISVDHEGIIQPLPGIREVRQQVNGGGKRIEMHSMSGHISIE